MITAFDGAGQFDVYHEVRLFYCLGLALVALCVGVLALVRFCLGY